MMRVRFGEIATVVVPFVLAFAVVLGTRTESRVDAGVGSSHRRAVVADATGRRVQVRRYARIASSSMLIDRLLLELVEPDRVLGFSRHGFEGSSVAYRFGDKSRIDANEDLERLASLRPDVLIVNNFVDPGRIRRLNDAGIAIFDLGEMRGLDSLLEDIRAVGELLDEVERAETLARRFRTRMHQVATDIPEARRPTAIYVGVHGTQIFGGARDTSYHDVLEAAGLVDVAARRYRGWPSYTPEDILSLAPDYIVSPRGQGRGICRLNGLATLAACRSPNGIIEIDVSLMVDPGLTMLDAAEEVRAAVHGSPVP